MSKPRKKQGNPDFRHRVTPPAPTNEEIETRLFELISPGTFANLKGIKDKDRSLRSRILTLPVMAAIVLSRVYRQVQHITDVLRSLEIEGLMWVEATKVSKQALSQRLMIPWLVEHHRSMGLVKAVRQRHRRTAFMSLEIWADALT